MRSYVPSLAVLFFILSLSATTSAFPQYARQRRDVNLQDPSVVAGLNNIVASLLAPSTCNSTYKVDHVRYPFQAPGPNDKRGGCPGLNSLANHGYLPRNGIVTAVQLKDALTCIVNFNVAIATGLIIAGYLTTADPVLNQGSIGSPVLNADGTPTSDVGMCHHTGIEKDASLVGTDVGLGGDCKVNNTLWNQFKTISENGATPWDADSLADAHYARFLDSKSNNPTFTWQAFPFVTTCAAGAFSYVKFSEGLLARDTASQGSWFVDNKIPASFVDKGVLLSAQQVVDITNKFLARHQDPTWTYNVQVPSNPNCNNCWWRFMIESTFVGFGNILQPLYNQIAPYSQCVLYGCPAK